MRSHTTKDANPFGPAKGARAGANPFGSGGAGGGGGGNPFGAWADLGPEAEDESVEQIQGRIDGHAARIEESQRRMLQKAAEARQIGSSTLAAGLSAHLFELDTSTFRKGSAYKVCASFKQDLRRIQFPFE